MRAGKSDCAGVAPKNEEEIPLFLGEKQPFLPINYPQIIAFLHLSDYTKPCQWPVFTQVDADRLARWIQEQWRDPLPVPLGRRHFHPLHFLADCKTGLGDSGWTAWKPLAVQSLCAVLFPAK